MPSNLIFSHYIASIMSSNNQNEVKKPLEKEEDKEISSPSTAKEKSIEEKLKESEDKVLRLLAEIENQRRRFEKEIKDAFEFGSFNFAKESLAILDNLHRAKEAIRNDEILKTNKDLDKFLENISIIEKDLITIFEKNRIKKIDTQKKKFDPNLHQAMSEIENVNVEPGVILQEIQAGYMLGERLLRPALVSVAKKSSKKAAEKDEKKVGK
mgnify:CR=1 FL=1|tara:strand:+ start:377 stop:1009 length:633 start_codon:yes stop_codon:yes gene_type:complete